MRYPLSQELIYRRALKQLVRDFTRLVKLHLYPIIPDLIAATEQTTFIQDAGDDWNNQLNNALTKITNGMTKPIRITEEQMRSVGSGTNQFNKKEWQRLIRDAYGVQLSPEDAELYRSRINLWADQNSKLITNIPAKSAAQIREETIKALQSGTTVKDFQNIVQERLNVSDSRAELIARDQVAKLNGELTQARQEDAGVNEYIWRTVGDERVRDSHAEVDGLKFSWDSPPTQTDGNHPGEDYQCRCWAEPILPAIMNMDVPLDEAA